MRFAAAFVPLLLFPSLLAQDAGGAHDLKVQTKKGTQARLEVTETTAQSFSVMGQDIENSLQQKTDYDVEVLDVAEDGKVTARITWVAMSGKMDQGMMGQQEFDTRKQKPGADDNPAVAMMTALVGHSIEFVFDSKGEVVEAKKLDEVLAKVRESLPEELAVASASASTLSEDAIRKQVQFFGNLPKEPVATGDTWKDDDVLTGTVALQMKSTHKLVQADGDAIVLEVASDEIKLKEGAELPPQLQGATIETPKFESRTEISAADGLLRKAARTFTMVVVVQPPGAEEPVQVQIRRVVSVARGTPTPAAAEGEKKAGEADKK